MIFPLAGIVLGIMFGAVRAKMRGGKVLDMIQWAAVFAMIFGIIGLFIVIGIDRSYQG